MGFYLFIDLYSPQTFNVMDVKMETGWKLALKQEFSKPYFQQVVTFLKTERLQKKIIYPPGSLIFNAFDQTPFEKVKVVILGQDPYHGHMVFVFR
jgi:uracil-DNA glycosylase